METEFTAKGELVNTELGWCACDRPYEVDRMMLAYLDVIALDTWPRPPPRGVSDDATTLLAYIADHLGWTDHGTSVGGAWLTDAGQVARSNLRAAQDD